MSLPIYPAVKVNNLSIQYPNTTEASVNRISFAVSSGEVVGILGGNGAGKSTTLKAIAGLLPTLQGSEILIQNISITNQNTKEQARSLVGYCPDTSGLIRQATVDDHIQLLLGNKKDISSLVAYNVVERMGLSEHLTKEAGSFSHGMSRRLAVALAILNSEDVLILDEPFDGVDPLGVEAIQDMIDTAKAKGLAVLISTHLLNLLAFSSDRILVMNKGRIIFEESANFFKNDDSAKRYSEILKSDMEFRG